MAETRKVLGQSAPSATTLTDLYTVPASTQAVVSSITVCNRSAQSDKYRLAVSVAGAAVANKDYFVYDATVNANDTVVFTVGITLGAADKLRVYAGGASLSFAAYGVELT